jgi:hypothetical protein
VNHFRDAAGVEWEVYEVAAQALGTGRLDYLPDKFRRGWLVFECDTEKRRLAPIPPEWESLSLHELQTLVADESCVRVPKAAPTA